MTAPLISVRTRNAIRDVLKARTLQELKDLFEECGINAGFSTYLDPKLGERQRLIERYFSPLDLNLHGDALRLLRVLGRIAEERPDVSPGTKAPDMLQQALHSDGFALENQKLFATAIEKQILFPDFAPRNSVSRSTREKIRDSLVQIGVNVEGTGTFRNLVQRFAGVPKGVSMTEVAETFLKASRTLSSLESPALFGTKPVDWPDEPFLRLLTESLHPEVRRDVEAERILAIYNKHLVVGGWEIVKGNPGVGEAHHIARPRDNGVVALPDPIHAEDILSNEYVRELAGKCDSRLASGDLEGAVTVARTFLESILYELELRISGKRGEHKGDLPRQFKAVTKLLRMDEERTDLDSRFKDVIRGLVSIANGLAPLRNKMSDGHARERKPAPHHARLVVNSARTVASFLVESYNHQLEKGLIIVPAAIKESAS